MNLIRGGTLSFQLFQNFFKFNIPCNDSCKHDFHTNFTEHTYSKFSFSLTKNNAELNKQKPILFYFGGLGVSDIQHRLQLFLNYENALQCINPVVFSIHMEAIHDLNKMINIGYDLYVNARKEYPEYTFAFVGHSLGSGIAAHVVQTIYEKENNPPIFKLILISSYPNLSAIYEHSSLKPLIKYLFRNILDNDNALKSILKVDPTFSKKIILLQGKHDKIFSSNQLETMLKDILYKNVSLILLDSDHFEPADFMSWNKYLC
jgi:hypothetical protein